jgi:hypothetical protein
MTALSKQLPFRDMLVPCDRAWGDGIPDTLAETVQQAIQHPKVTTIDIVRNRSNPDFRDMTSRIASLLI